MRHISFDTETTGLNPWLGAKVFAFSTCDEDENIEVWRLDGKDGIDPEDGERALRSLIDQAISGDVCLVMANAKFDLRMVEHHLNTQFAEDIKFHDVLIQAHMLRNDHPTLKLKDLAWEFGGIPTDDEDAIKPYYTGTDEKGDETIDFSRVPAHLMYEYQKQDVIRTMLLHLFFWPKIKENKTWLELYHDEMELIRTTLRMEERGVLLNRKRCLQLSEQLNQGALGVLDDCEKVMGKRINLGNDNRVRELLYNTLRMPVLKRTKTGEPSADKDTLGQLKVKHPHEVLDMVLKYKSWSRGSTILKKYITFVDENDVVHPDIRTCGAGTGRESCSKPNLQNVAKDAAYMNPYPVPARKAFRPRPGFVHFHLDYSGVEFRLAVILTGDEKLLDFVRRGEDLHVLGANLLIPELWKSSPPEKRGILRGAMKNANFAKMFGGGKKKVGQTVGVPITKDDFRRYDNVFGALDYSARQIISFAKEHGYVETIHGRRLWVPAHKSYVGVNYKIQGSAAEVLKRSQVRVHHYLRRETNNMAKLLLPIHDEVIIEWPRSMLDVARPMLRDIRLLMIDFPLLAAPLDVGVEIATYDWASKKEYDLWQD